MITRQSPLFSEIENVIKNLKPESITAERKKTLQPLIDFIQSKTTNHQEIRLNLICTHNSRRSHLSQVWAQTALLFAGTILVNMRWLAQVQLLHTMFRRMRSSLETQRALAVT